MFSKKSGLCLISVHLPYCSRAKTDEFLACRGKLKQLCEELQCPNICFVGDFNAGATNTVGGLLEAGVWSRKSRHPTATPGNFDYPTPTPTPTPGRLRPSAVLVTYLK